MSERSGVAGSRLWRLLATAGAATANTAGSTAAPGTGTGAEAAGDGGDAVRCELCAGPIPATHRHLLDLDARELRCACRACAVLFDDAAAGGRRYRLVPDRRWRLPGFVLDEAVWAALRIPVEMAFLFHDTRAGRVVAFYPSPAGAVESLLDLADWQGLVAANPVLATLRPDVEALLVNRARGGRGHWLVPIDDCYALVGLIRTHWQGLGGGTAVWAAIGEFFDDLGDRARPVRAAERPRPAGAAGPAAVSMPSELRGARR